MTPTQLFITYIIFGMAYAFIFMKTHDVIQGVAENSDEKTRHKINLVLASGTNARRVLNVVLFITTAFLFPLFMIMEAIDHIKKSHKEEK